MVESPLTAATLAALIVALLVSAAEWLHSQRIARVSYLAFGRDGRPRAWTKAVPIVRVLSIAAIAWGFTALTFIKPTAVDEKPTKEASKHLLVCLDASPSMFVEDSGPDGKRKRSVWAGEVIQAILDRLDTETTRVTVFAVYTKSIPIIEDTFDLNVVRNVLDGLPLYTAFESGATKLSSGVNDALAYAKQWQPGSATLLVVSDGDSEERVTVKTIPPSIADAIVIGVGDPVRPTMIAGHRSTQDVSSLQSLATKLRGLYHQGNSNHLPTNVLKQLTMIRPRITDGIGLREWALVAIGVGASLLALVAPALHLFGRSLASHAVDHRSIARGINSAPNKGQAEPNQSVRELIQGGTSS